MESNRIQHRPGAGHINYQLRLARLSHTWTIKRAAIEVGVSPQAYIRWELGTQVPHLSSLEMLCKAFRMKPDELGFGRLVEISEE